MKMRFIQKFLTVFFLIILCGCGNDNASVELSGINYTDKNITGYSVNGYYAGNIHANSGGGSFFCCVLLPRNWRNDLTVNVEWNEEGVEEKKMKSLCVPVPKYEKSDIGFFAIHFYPNGEVKVLVTTKTFRYPGYPYPPPERK
jgi:hypothetical protein